MGRLLAVLLTPTCCVPCSVRLLLLLLLLLLWCWQGTKVSVNDFVLRAAALALRDTPAANAFWDKGSEAAVQQPSVDVCVAVATDGGLITPIVKAADTKSLMQVGAALVQWQHRRWVGRCFGVWCCASHLCCSCPVSPSSSLGKLCPQSGQGLSCFTHSTPAPSFDTHTPPPPRAALPQQHRSVRR